MKWKPLAVLCSCAIWTLPSYSQTLEQAVSMALSTNPELKSTFNQFQSMRYDHRASDGAYLPKVDLEAGVGREIIDPTISSGDERTNLTRKDATISLTQLIWDGSNTLNDKGRTAAEAEAQRYQLLADAQDMALQVTKAYLDAVQAQQVLFLTESNLATHKDIYKDIKRRVESGLGSTADLTQIETRVSKAHANLLAAQNNLFDAHTEYLNLVGVEPRGLRYPRVDKTRLPHSNHEATEVAYQHHPVIKVAQSDIDAAHFQYKQSKSGYYPTFTFEASNSWLDDAGGDVGSSTELSAMLRMRYNLYNGGSDAANAKSSAYQLNKSKDLLDSAFRQVKQGLSLSWSALDLTSQQKDFLADQVDYASETVIAYDKQYRIGKRTLLDLLNTEDELFEARRSYVEAQFAEQYAKYRVLNATGQLLDTLRVDTPEEWNQEVEY